MQLYNGQGMWIDGDPNDASLFSKIDASLITVSCQYGNLGRPVTVDMDVRSDSESDETYHISLVQDQEDDRVYKGIWERTDEAGDGLSGPVEAEILSLVGASTNKLLWILKWNDGNENRSFIMKAAF